MDGFDQDEFEEAQLRISSFEPHHSTTLIYPECSHLNVRDGEKMCLIDLNRDSDTAERYEPVPLIRDRAVQNHAGRENEEEVSMFTRTKALGIVPAEGPAMSSPHLDPFDRLVQDMATAERYLGTTTLSMLTYQTPGQPNRIDHAKARVSRDTTYRRLGGQIMSDYVVYEFPALRIFSDLGRLSQDDAGWSTPLGQLPWRRMDRMYRHVRLRLLMHRRGDMLALKYNFKPPRRERSEKLIDTKLTPVDPKTLPDDDKICPVCTNTLGEEEALDPVALPCNGKHVLCKPCVLTWIDSVQVEEASCPLCRDKIFNNQREVDDLKFGLVNGIYEWDDRYTDFENFERSCTDLDQELAANNNSSFTLHAHLLVHIWDSIVDGACLEQEDDGNGTPFYLQAVQFPEWDTADETLRQQLFSLDGTSTTPSGLTKLLLDRVYRTFLQRFVSAGMLNYISNSEREALCKNPVDAGCLDIRPGFKECFKRCLNRMLRFYALRQCGCEDEFHEHGGREYYSPSDLSVYHGADRWRNGVDADGDIEMEG